MLPDYVNLTLSVENVQARTIVQKTVRLLQITSNASTAVVNMKPVIDVVKL